MRHRVALNCTEVSQICPLDDTIYGYAPNLGISAFFVAFFSLCAILQVFFGMKGRTYFFLYTMTFGCLGEAIGYAGRIVMHGNAYSSLGFKIQISCLIFSPAFIAAGIYVTLKHLVLTFSPSNSFIHAYLYTWIFINCDFFSLILQAIGGGFAGGADGNNKLLNLGTNLMISGIVFQVATLLVFFSLVLDFVFRASKNWDDVRPEGKTLLETKKFKLFLFGLIVAFSTIFLRCIYRIAEMVGGWANPIMRNEIGFDIMEGFMIVLAVLSLTVFHPATCFPQLAGKKEKVSSTISSDENEVVLDHREEK